MCGNVCIGQSSFIKKNYIFHVKHIKVAFTRRMLYMCGNVCVSDHQQMPKDVFPHGTAT